MTEGRNSPRRDQEFAAAIAGRATLLDVRLMMGMVSAELLPEGSMLKWSLTQRPSVEVVEDEPNFIVEVEYTLRVFVEGAEDTDAQPSFNATFGALYGVPESDAELLADEQALNAFARTSASLALFPYAREFFSTVTSRVGLPTLTMPPFKIPSPWHDDPVEDD